MSNQTTKLLPGDNNAMKLSARNQFEGTIAKITAGAVNGIAAIDINGTTVTADITMNSIKELGLEEGKKVCAVIKASEVMVGLGGHLPLSARNQFPGTVVSVEKGAVNAIVKMDVLGGNIMSASITNASVEEMDLAPGAKVLAVIKSSSVMVGI